MFSSAVVFVLPVADHDASLAELLVLRYFVAQATVERFDGAVRQAIKN
jgi:hypothetical protein